MTKGNKGFGSMFTEGLDNEAELDNASPSEGIMASRSQTLARIASGKTVTDRTDQLCRIVLRKIKGGCQLHQHAVDRLRMRTDGHHVDV